MLEVDEDSRLGREILPGGTRYGAATGPRATSLPTSTKLRSSARRAGSPPLRNFQFRLPGPRIPPQYEILVAGALRRLWQRRPLLRWPAPLAKSRIPKSNISAPGEPVSAECNPLEERFFVGLRLTHGIRPEPREWQLFGEPIAALSNRVCSKPMEACCASPAAA